MECPLDHFIFHIPHGWKVVWKLGNVRQEFVQAMQKLRSPGDFVEFAGVLRARGRVVVDESLSPMFYADEAEERWVFEQIEKLAGGDIEVLGALSELVHGRWESHYDSLVDKMAPLARSRSPLDFFILFREDGAAILDEVMLREEMKNVVRPKVYSHTEESQDASAYLVTSDPAPTLKPGDQRWAMVLAACIVSERGDSVPFDRNLSPVIPSPELAAALKKASAGSVQSLHQIVSDVHGAWTHAAQFCRMLDDSGIPDEVNDVIKGRGIPPDSMRGYHKLEDICPLVIDVMSELEARGVVSPRRLAGDPGTSEYKKWVLGLPEDDKERMEFVDGCAHDGKSISKHHKRCVEWAGKRKVNAKVAAQAANYFSRLPYSLSRISLRWGMVKAMGGTLGDYVRFSAHEKQIGMRDMEREMVFRLEDDDGWLHPSGKIFINIHPRFDMIKDPDPLLSLRFDEAGYYERQVRRQRLLEKIGLEQYILSNGTEENAPERNRVMREKKERIALYTNKRARK